MLYFKGTLHPTCHLITAIKGKITKDVYYRIIQINLIGYFAQVNEFVIITIKII